MADQASLKKLKNRCDKIIWILEINYLNGNDNIPLHSLFKLTPSMYITTACNILPHLWSNYTHKAQILEHKCWSNLWDAILCTELLKKV